MTPDRRGFLAGAAAMAATPAVGGVTARLDAAAAIIDPVAALRLLDGLAGAGLTTGERLDLQAAREGLAIDARLAAAPDPATRFALSVDRQFGLPGDPGTLHRRFEAEAARLTARADVLLTRCGHRDGSIAERFGAAFRDPAHLYPDSDAGRDQAVADMNARLAAVLRRVPALVGPVPPESLRVSARRMTAAEVASGKQGFRILPKSDGTPGFYIVDLHRIRDRPRWSLGSVVHHELLPGHMVQMPIEARAAPHPLRVRCTAGWAEGWGIHAEALMAGEGAFAGDPAGELGHVHWLLFRIARALADTGLATQGWTREQARARTVALMGEPAYFAPFDTDIARIAVQPGVRAGEALAWLALADAAGRARDRRRFHQAVLAHGALRWSQLRAL